MIVDPWWWLILLLLFCILLALFYLVWKKRERGDAPVIVFENRINVPCGTTDDVYTNFLGPMKLNVELKVDGQCEVTLKTKGLGNFLSRDSVQKTSGATAIPLGTRDSISYSCKADLAKDSRCEFTLKITRI